MKLNNTYFILRHGQTPYQLKEEDIIYPFPEKEKIFLTEEGKEQVERAAEKLKDKNIDVIFSSPINRTRQTSKIVKEKLGNIEAIFDNRLREKDAGIFKGRPKKEYDAYFKSREEKFWKAPPQGENWSDVKERMMNFLSETNEKYKNKNVLIISHQGPLLFLQAGVQELNQEEILEKRKELSPKTGELRCLSDKKL